MTLKRFRKMLNKHNSFNPLLVICRSKSMYRRCLIELKKHPGKSAIIAKDYKELELRTNFYYQSYLEDNEFDYALEYWR